MDIILLFEVIRQINHRGLGTITVEYNERRNTKDRPVGWFLVDQPDCQALHGPSEASTLPSFYAHEQFLSVSTDEPSCPQIANIQGIVVSSIPSQTASRYLTRRPFTDRACLDCISFENSSRGSHANKKIATFTLLVSSSEGIPYR